MLFDRSEESPGVSGLGVLAGTVRLAARRREAPADAVEPGRRRRRRRPDVRRARRAAVVLLRALAARRPRRPGDRRRDVRLRRHRSTPRSGAATCSPPSSIPRSRPPPASACSATS